MRRRRPRAARACRSPCERSAARAVAVLASPDGVVRSRDRRGWRPHRDFSRLLAVLPWPARPLGHAPPALHWHLGSAAAGRGGAARTPTEAGADRARGRLRAGLDRPLLHREEPPSDVSLSALVAGRGLQDAGGSDPPPPRLTAATARARRVTSSRRWSGRPACSAGGRRLTAHRTRR